MFLGRLFWLGREPLKVGKRYMMKLNTTEAQVEVQEIKHVIDTEDLGEAAADQVERNSVAEVVLRSKKMLALDAFSDLPRTGRFVLIDKYDIAGGGIASMEGYAEQRRLITVASTEMDIWAGCSGSPGSLAPANRPWQLRWNAGCSTRAIRLMCWMATMCGTA